MIGLAVLFLVTALLYATVGFGGGSTYNALLVLSDVDYRILPTLALICNVIVVTGGVWRFHRNGNINVRRIAPFVIFSIPLAWLGGRIPVSEVVFVAVLGFSLLAAGAHMLAPLEKQHTHISPDPKQQWALCAVIGGGLGFVSGMVGIGGGIFLAPILYFLRWDSPRVIAGTCSFFILVNSLSGLAGQATKLDDLDMLRNIADYWLLFAAVLIGGQIGSTFGAAVLSETLLKRMTALLMFYVAIRLLIRAYQLVLA